MTKISTEPYGQLSDGTTIERYTLQNDGISAAVITYGARIESLKTPNHRGDIEEIVLGFDSLDGYVRGREYTGAVVGRYANRIAGGRFALDGITHYLSLNAPPNSMHGGLRGFDRQVWTACVEDEALSLTYESPSAEEGYPGRVTAVVRYSMTKNRIKIEYSAWTDRPTIINLTNHSYFNLTGNPALDIMDHEMILLADHITPVDSMMIPTGDVQDVSDTPFDFRNAARVGSRINDSNEQLRRAGGYDHNWILRAGTQPSAIAAIVYEPTSGRLLEVLTSQPGLQFYSGNNLTGLEMGRNEIFHRYRCGLCLETQHFPDSPNHPMFPSTELYPGHAFHSETVFQFSTRACDG